MKKYYNVTVIKNMALVQEQMNRPKEQHRNLRPTHMWKLDLGQRWHQSMVGKDGLFNLVNGVGSKTFKQHYGKEW